MSRYRRKTEIIEAIKWDGNINTIKNNDWLEDAIKEDKIILGMNNTFDKDPVLLLNGFGDIKELNIGCYIIKEKHKEVNDEYIIRCMDAESFERNFESIEDYKKNCVEIDLKLNTEEFLNDLNEAKEELKKIMNNNVKDSYSFKVVTKDMYIANMAGEVNLDIIDINKTWEKISKGYNFVLLKDDSDIKRYYNVEYINELFKR